MECKKEENLKDCPCTYPGCERKGTCCDCIKYHWEMGELPACFFSKEVSLLCKVDKIAFCNTFPLKDLISDNR